MRNCHLLVQLYKFVSSKQFDCGAACDTPSTTIVYSSSSCPFPVRASESFVQFSSALLNTPSKSQICYHRTFRLIITNPSHCSNSLSPSVLYQGAWYSTEGLSEFKQCELRLCNVSSDLKALYKSAIIMDARSAYMRVCVWNAWPATGRSALQDLRSCAILQASLALSPVSSSICCTHVRQGRPRWRFHSGLVSGLPSVRASTARRSAEWAGVASGSRRTWPKMESRLRQIRRPCYILPMFFI